MPAKPKTHFTDIMTVHLDGFNHPNTSGTPAHSIKGILGSDGFTITGGYGNVTSVARPRAQDYTVVTDWPAITFDLNLRFDSWNIGTFNADVERTLNVLWWMAGRGTQFKNSTPGSGDPPYIKISTFHAGGKPSRVIPEDLKQAKWWISNISYDTTNTIRHTVGSITARNGQHDGLSSSVQPGDRAVQEVTISFTQVHRVPQTSQKEKHALQQTAANSVVSRKSTAKANTLRAMCNQFFGKSDQASVSQVNGLNPKLTPTKKLTAGTVVRFPSDW